MYTMQQVIDANRAAGHHWFDWSTMRFFRTRLCPNTVKGLPDGGALFVTSECGPDRVRRYSVRRAHPRGAVSTIGGFQAYATRAQAFAALRNIHALESAVAS